MVNNPRIIIRNWFPTHERSRANSIWLLGGGIGPVIVGQVLAATGSYTTAILSISFLCALGGIFMLILGRMIKY